MAREHDFVDEIIRIEGDFVHDPDDQGNETRFGIIVATARRNGYMGDMRELPIEKAKEIYIREYYYEPGFDKIKDDKLAFELFDTAVNMGPETAVEFLQKAWNLLNVNHQFGDDLVVDGKLGIVTLARVNGYLFPRRIHMLVNSVQCFHYIEIAQKKVSQRKFIYGWVNGRVFSQVG